MTVYVDDMRAPFGRMVMCHMVADSDDELHAMAARIGVARRWHQAPPAHDSHYDIAQSKKKLAVMHGAVAITRRELSAMVMRRRVTGALGLPVDAEAWARDYMHQRKEAARPASHPIPVEGKEPGAP